MRCPDPCAAPGGPYRSLASPASGVILMVDRYRMEVSVQSPHVTTCYSITRGPLPDGRFKRMLPEGSYQMAIPDGFASLFTLHAIDCFSSYYGVRKHDLLRGRPGPELKAVIEYSIQESQLQCHITTWRSRDSAFACRWHVHSAADTQNKVSARSMLVGARTYIKLGWPNGPMVVIHVPS